MHAVCEANYARLLRLFPIMKTPTAAISLWAMRKCHWRGGALPLYHDLSPAPAARPGRLAGTPAGGGARYHDAGMLEVGMFQSHRRIAARYQYPNERMHQQDEKSQQNRFLADWLEHCLQNGRATVGLRTVTGLY